MDKYLNIADIQDIVSENLELEKFVRKFCSANQEPVIVLKREVFEDSHIRKSSLVYRLYFRSHLDPHLVLLKVFHSLDSFCLWYVGRHPYREFELINYSQLWFTFLNIWFSNLNHPSTAPAMSLLIINQNHSAWTRARSAQVIGRMPIRAVAFQKINK